jgi:DNA-binding transcriptional regulator YiaG
MLATGNRSEAKMTTNDPMNTVLKTVRGRRLALGAGREIRRMAGVTLEQMAALVGVDAPLISKWERGIQVPTGCRALRWWEACEEIRAALDDPEVISLSPPAPIREPESIPA